MLTSLTLFTGNGDVADDAVACHVMQAHAVRALIGRQRHAHDALVSQLRRPPPPLLQQGGVEVVGHNRVLGLTAGRDLLWGLERPGSVCVVVVELRFEHCAVVGRHLQSEEGILLHRPLHVRLGHCSELDETPRQPRVVKRNDGQVFAPQSFEFACHVERVLEYGFGPIVLSEELVNARMAFVAHVGAQNVETPKCRNKSQRSWSGFQQMCARRVC